MLSSVYSPFVSQQRNEMCLTSVHAATRAHLAHLFFIASENRILGEYSGMCRVLLLVLVGTSVEGCYFLSPFMLQFSWTESFRQKAHISWIPAVGVFPSQGCVSQSQVWWTCSWALEHVLSYTEVLNPFRSQRLTHWWQWTEL